MGARPWTHARARTQRGERERGGRNGGEGEEGGGGEARCHAHAFLPVFDEVTSLRSLGLLHLSASSTTKLRPSALAGPLRWFSAQSPVVRPDSDNPHDFAENCSYLEVRE
jgi:hypothetical protein